jgi:hypothetical protein
MHGGVRGEGSRGADLIQEVVKHLSKSGTPRGSTHNHVSVRQTRCCCTGRSGSRVLEEGIRRVRKGAAANAAAADLAATYCPHQTPAG